MKKSGITTLFILVCIAVLLASYGVGLGIKKIRFAAAQAKATDSTETAKQDDKSEPDQEKVVEQEDTPAEPSEEVAAEPDAESDEDTAASPERPEGRRMMGPGMGERFRNMSEQERQEAMARMRERFGGRGGRGGSRVQLSDEDRENLRAEMEELNAKAGEISEDEMRQARNEILEKYGLPTGGRGGRRRFGDRE